MKSFPVLGCGVGLRSKHYPFIMSHWPAMDWFEVISENYMDSGGRPLQVLEKIRAHYPVALHGTSLSIGSSDPLNSNYLARLKKLIERIDPFIVSDHLCWTSAGGEQLHDLLPLPFTEESIHHVSERIQKIQDFLGRRMLLENVSTYVTFKHSVMPEWEFLAEVSKRSGCGILLDLNNIYVNAMNHGFNALDYLKNIPGERVGQIHLAGHTDMGDFLFDTHSCEVIDKVWDLYREALKRWGQISTLIEWDEDIPEFADLANEAEKAREIYRQFEKSSAPSAESQPENRKKFSRQESSIPLTEIQEWIKMRVQPEKNPLAAQKNIFGTFLNPQGGVSGEERMSVYSKGYIARVHESLAEVYEAVHHVIGSEAFLVLASDYAARFPSRHYNLNFVGIHFPEFLKDSEISGQFAFLPDLARLEWRVWQAFHAFHEIPMDLKELTSVTPEDWEKAKIIFQPSVTLMNSAWPVLDIWLARHKNPGEMKIQLHNRPQHVLIGRKDIQVRCELLDQNQYRLMETLLSGESLGAACERLADTLEAESLPVAEWFARWVADGLIVRCEISVMRI